MFHTLPHVRQSGQLNVGVASGTDPGVAGVGGGAAGEVHGGLMNEPNTKLFALIGYRTQFVI